MNTEAAATQDAIEKEQIRKCALENLRDTVAEYREVIYQTLRNPDATFEARTAKLEELANEIDEHAKTARIFGATDQEIIDARQ